MNRHLAPILVGLLLIAGCTSPGQAPNSDPFLVGRTRIPPPGTGEAAGRSADPAYPLSPSSYPPSPSSPSGWQPTGPTAPAAGTTTLPPGQPGFSSGVTSRPPDSRGASAAFTIVQFCAACLADGSVFAARRAGRSGRERATLVLGQRYGFSGSVASGFEAGRFIARVPADGRRGCQSDGRFTEQSRSASARRRQRRRWECRATEVARQRCHAARRQRSARPRYRRRGFADGSLSL